MLRKTSILIKNSSLPDLNQLTLIRVKMQSNNDPKGQRSSQEETGRKSVG